MAEYDGAEYVDTYDKDDVLVSSIDAEENGYSYIYGTEDAVVSLYAEADDGYEVSWVWDADAGEDVLEEPAEDFSYWLYMDGDKSVSFEFAKDGDETAASEAAEKADEAAAQAAAEKAEREAGEAGAQAAAEAADQAASEAAEKAEEAAQAAADAEDGTEPGADAQETAAGTETETEGTSAETAGTEAEDAIQESSVPGETNLAGFSSVADAAQADAEVETADPEEAAEDGTEMATETAEDGEDGGQADALIVGPGGTPADGYAEEVTEAVTEEAATEGVDDALIAAPGKAWDGQETETELEPETETEAGTETETETILDTEETEAGLHELSASDGYIDVAVRMADGSKFPDGTTLTLYDNEGLAEISGLMEDAVAEGFNGAWAEDGTVYPYYAFVAGQDGDYESFESVLLAYTVTVHDEELAVQVSDGNKEAKIGMHDPSTFETLSIYGLGTDRKELQSAYEYTGAGLLSIWYGNVKNDGADEDSNSSGEDYPFVSADLSYIDPVTRVAYATTPKSGTLADGNPAHAPTSLTETSGAAQTHWRKITFKGKDGNSYERDAFCLEGIKGNPGEGTYSINSFTELDGTGSKQTLLRKALYYLYTTDAYTAWGYDVELSTGETVDLRECLIDGGCEDRENRYAMTHYVLGYIYTDNDETVWNRHPNGNVSLNSAGVKLVKKIVNYLKLMPDPKDFGIDKTSATATYDDAKGLNVSDSFTFNSFSGNKTSIALGTGVTLVNETKGKSYTGTGYVYGGDTFHFEADTSVTGKITYKLNSRAAVDFSAWKLNAESSSNQDIAVAFFSTDTTTSISVTWPDGDTPTPEQPGSGNVYVKKTSLASSEILELDSYSLAGAEFEVVGGGNKWNLITDESGISNQETLPDNSWWEYFDPVYDKDGNYLYTPSPVLHSVTTTYTVSETKAPAGHEQYIGTKTFTVTMPADRDKTIEIDFEDTPIFCKNSLEVEKLGVKGEKIQGVVFKVEYYDAASADPSKLKKTWYLESDANGMVLIDEAHKSSKADYASDGFYMYDGKIVLPIGGYLQVTEVDAPAEYEVDDTPFGFATEENAEYTKRFYNDLVRCQIRLQKFEEDGSTPIAGVEYELKFLEESITATADKNPNFKRLLEVGETVVRSTDDNGETYFDNLDQGTYQITEIRTFPGHTLLKDPIIVTLPMQMTEEEAEEYGNVDFGSAKLDAGYTGQWFFYDCLYEITDTAQFEMPTSGGTGGWEYGFAGFGILGVTAAGIFAYDTKFRRKRRRKLV